MNVRWKGSLLGLLFFLCTGCRFIASPSELLQVPVISVDLQELRYAVTKLLPNGTQLAVPQKLDQASGSIQEVDLDGDGVNEAVAFFQREKNEFEFGILVLKKTNGIWNKLDEIRELGKNIEYVEMVFHENTRGASLLVGWSGGEDVTSKLSMYRLQADKMIESDMKEYTRLMVTDLNRDGIEELLLIHLDRNRQEAFVNQYEAGGTRFVQTNSVQLDDRIIALEQVIAGNATARLRGLFINAATANSTYQTSLLIMEEGQLRNVLSSEAVPSYGIVNPRASYSEDVNGDGIVEIAIMQEATDVNDDQSDPFYDSARETVWIHHWHQWSEQNELVLVLDNYYDFTVGFRFDFPAAWNGHVDIRKRQVYEERMTSFEYREHALAKPVELLRLHAFPVRLWNEKEKQLLQQQTAYTPLGEHNDFVFYCTKPLEAELPSAELDMSLDEVKRSFQPIPTAEKGRADGESTTTRR